MTLKRLSYLLQLTLALSLLAFSLLPARPARAANPAIIYVNAAASGATRDGTSWATAFASLQSALIIAQPGSEIWVAAGTYKPGADGQNAATFTLKSGVGLYGGFDGGETLRSQRDWVTNVTTLSGDLDGDSTLSTNDAYHVVSGSNLASNTEMDGFTITGGNGLAAAMAAGGGMILKNSNLKLVNIIFSGNHSISGGGLSNQSGGSPTLINVIFKGNSADGAGGNTGGGGMDTRSGNPTLINVIFIGNSAKVTMPDSVGGGGLYILNGSPTLTNVTFSSNSAYGAGGGLYIYGGSITLQNSILWDNTVNGSSSQIYGSATVGYSLVQGSSSTSNGNLNGTLPGSDPLFVNAAAGDLRLQSGSPAINVGNASLLPATDLAGLPRIWGGTVDLGAHEFNGRLYVKAGATAPGNGGSWGTAFPSLQTALATTQNALPAVKGSYEIWVAGGTYTPTTGTDRSASFNLVNGVGVYGGFDGTESARSQRDWVTNLTTLSGDIGTTGVSTDNSYHVVYGSGLDNSTVLDGFTISGGNANGIPPNERGGGMYLRNSNLTLTNLTFNGNSAGYGGGLYILYNSPTLTNVTFSGNSASGSGGGYTAIATVPL